MQHCGNIIYNLDILSFCNYWLSQFVVIVFGLMLDSHDHGRIKISLVNEIPSASPVVRPVNTMFRDMEYRGLYNMIMHFSINLAAHQNHSQGVDWRKAF